MYEDIDSLKSAVAANVIALREKREFSRDQLAQLSGVSKGMLAQVEQNRTNPSIATLSRLANALGVTISKLLEVAETPILRSVDIVNVPELWSGPKGSSAKLLQGVDEGTLVEFWEWKLAPGHVHEASVHPSGTKEILYVLDGRLKITVDAELIELRKGQSVQIPGNRPHRFENMSQRPARFVLVAVEP